MPANRTFRLGSLGIVLLTLLVLAIGLTRMPTSLVLAIDSPQAEAYLANFRTLERNTNTAYRWSFAQAALDLHAFARSPLIVDLRLTSPRPADEPPADLGLARGRWQTPPFAIRGDWRRYQVLVPASHYQPELSFTGTTFRPDERDRRSLGVAISRFGLHLPRQQPAILAAIQMLGFWRLLFLCTLPLACFVLVSGLGRNQRQSQIAGIVLSLASLGLVFWQASNPLNAAFVPAEAWLPLLLVLLSVGIWYTQRPWFRGIEQHLLRLLDSDRTRPLLIVATGLLVGSIMVAAMPAWEHPDESSHFEFAWLIANRDTWPTPGTTDPRISAINGGGRALYHQPLYHAALSLILRLVPDLPLISQLYIARSFSLVLFLFILFCAERICREVFVAHHPLRWLAPLAVALNPTIANLMTGVNNDVASAAVCSWALWGAARILVAGLTWRRALWLLSAIPLAIFCKNTGAILLGIVPLVFIAAFWKHRGWQWRWLLFAGMAGLMLLGVLTLRWSDPAHWYRWGKSTGQQALRTIRTEAPVGPHVLQLKAEAVPDYEGLSSPIGPDVQLAGETVTVGAWVWASRPATIWSPGVIHQVREVPLSADFHWIEVDTVPRFIAFRYDVPERLMFTHFMAFGVAPNDPEPLEIYMDGLVMAPGIYPTDQVPQFNPGGTAGGIWGGIPFTNLIRNGDAEQGWVYLHPTADALVSRYARRSLARFVASIADLETTLRLEFRDYLPWMSFISFGAYGGRIFLRDPAWQIVIPAMALVISAGVARGIWRLRQQTAQRRYLYCMIGIICLSVWGAILMAHLPVNFPGGLPSARYGFTMIIPTTMVYCAGWLLLWPQTHRRQAAIGLLLLLLLLTIAAVTTIQLFEHTACSFDPVRCAFRPVQLPLLGFTP
jgi:hypothetical protein